MKRRRAGFTLIELILAMSLAMVLLVALWAAMDVHVRLFRGGQHDVAEALLGRALLRRIADDLRSTIAPVGDGEKQAAGAAPTRLRGTRKWLQLEVDRTVAWRPTVEATEQGTPASAPVPDVGLHLVTYFVREAQPTVRTDEPAAAGGLVRRELSCLYRDQLAADERGTGTVRPAAVSAESEPPALARSLQGGTAGADGGESPSPEVLLSPEVQAIEFRYSDGSTWLESWDSSAAGGLPRAVGIAIALADIADAAAPQGRVEENPLVGDSTRELRTASLFDAPDDMTPWRVYRLTVLVAQGIPNATSQPTSTGPADPSPTAAPASGIGVMP